MYYIEDRALVKSFSWKERFASIIKVLPVLIIIGIMGSLYIVKNIAPDVPCIAGRHPFCDHRNPCHCQSLYLAAIGVMAAQ